MTKLGLRKLHVFPQVTKMGSIIGHRIDYKWGRGSEMPAAPTQEKLTQVPLTPSNNDFQMPVGVTFWCPLYPTIMQNTEIKVLRKFQSLTRRV